MKKKSKTKIQRKKMNLKNIRKHRRTKNHVLNQNHQTKKLPLRRRKNQTIGPRWKEDLLKKKSQSLGGTTTVTPPPDRKRKRESSEQPNKKERPAITSSVTIRSPSESSTVDSELYESDRDMPKSVIPRKIKQATPLPKKVKKTIKP